MEKTMKNASASKASQAQDTNKTNANNAPAPKMTAAETYAVAAALLKEHGTTSAIKAISASQREQYGAQVWASVWASVKDLRAKDIDAATYATRAEFRDAAAALESEYRRLQRCGKFGTMTSYIAATYATAAEFIAACYRDTIDGQPARRVSYVKTDADGNVSMILDAWQVLDYDGRRATAILDACLTSIRTHARKASNAGKDGARVVCTRTHKAGAIVGAFGVAIDDAANVRKGAPLAAEEYAKIDGKDVSKYASQTLTDYNASK